MRTPEQVMVDNLTKTGILLRELRDAAEKWQLKQRKRKDRVGL